jgi:biotin carboxyl carrier protein
MKKQFRITLNGKSYEVVAELLGEDASIAAPNGPRRTVRSSEAKAVAAPTQRTPSTTGGNGTINSPLAGKVVSIDVAQNDSVNAGQKVITLEAMKMNTVVSAPTSGQVAQIKVQAGDSVEEGQILMLIK